MSRVVTVGTIAPGRRNARGVGVAVAGYELEMRRRGLSEATISIRLRCLRSLQDECGPLMTVGHEEIARFLDRRDIGKVTRMNWLSHLHSFYGWAVVHEFTDRDPTARLTRPKLRRRLPRPVNETDYRHALAMARTPMMTAWLLLGGYAGLRCMEIAGLAWEHVDLPGRELWVTGKGGKERTVPVHDKVAGALEPFRRAGGPVFLTPALGVPFTPAQVSMLIGRHLRTCGVRATAHQLRHRFASQLLEETGDIEVVAEVCGHESLNTTRIYARSSKARQRRAVDLLA